MISAPASEWRRTWEGRLRAIFVRQFRPRPTLTLSEWADRYAVLPPEAGPEPGPWRTSRVPYLREVMDSISDRSIEMVVLMKGSQIGFTMGAVVMTIGYFIHQSPAPILAFQPTEGDAKKFSRKKLSPVIQATPELRARVAAPKSRDSRNTTLQKEFTGGTLGIGSAGSPRALRQESALVILLDEVDGYDESAGDEGDPVKLAEKRTSAYWRPVKVLGSTPTKKGESRIEQAYEASDQRRYYVPCPHCGEMQVLRWGKPDAAYGFKWGTLDDGSPDFDSIAYLCVGCGVLIDERHKLGMIAKGEWRPRFPERATLGYHLPQFYSPFPGARWPRILRDWYEAQGDPDLLQVFMNHVLAETWEEKNEDVEPTALSARAERWDADVPHGVGRLTAAVDVQDDRLEAIVVGWGAREESWLLTHTRFYGDPEEPALWAELETLLTRPWVHESGRVARVASCMIDSRFLPKTVATFVRPRQKRRIWASKGVDRGTELLKRATRPNRDRIKPFTISTYDFKTILFRRLATTRPGPGYMHFCAPTKTGADGEFFAQFGAEIVDRKVIGGKFQKRYRQIRRRNEAIDLYVLATAALYALGQPGLDKLPALAAQLSEPLEEQPTEKQPVASVGGRRRGGWVDGWKR